MNMLSLKDTEDTLKTILKTLNSEIEKGWSEMEAGIGRDSKNVFSDLRKRYAA